jgi:hypothetical protein
MLKLDDWALQYKKELGLVCYGSVLARFRVYRQMMNLFSGQGLEQEEDFESGLCVCLVLFHKMLR